MYRIPNDDDDAHRQSNRYSSSFTQPNKIQKSTTTTKKEGINRKKDEPEPKKMRYQ